MGNVANMVNTVNHVSWAVGLSSNDSVDSHEFFWTSGYGWCGHPTGQPVITNQVPTQTATNISANITNPLVNSTNQDTCGHPTDHELVWFWLEGKAGCDLGLVQIECRSIELVVHQELGVEDPTIELLGCVDRNWQCCGCGMGSKKLLRMEWWMGALCHLECIPCSSKNVIQEFKKEDGYTLGGCWVDRPIKVRKGNAPGCHRPAPSQKLQGSSLPGGYPEDRTSQQWGFGDSLPCHFRWPRSSPFKRGGHIQSMGF